MTIGEKIKHLRQKNDVTQEKLAEYLNITYQSVSKWENNNALPDISLVVPIANFFEVSIDELFDRDTEAAETEIAEYRKRDLEYGHNGLIRERISLWRDAVQKYPRDFCCLYMLATSVWSTINTGGFENEVIQENAKEVVSICERILRDCTESEWRNNAIQLLVYTYGNPCLDIADEEKAVDYANMAGGLYVSRELLLEHAYFTNDGKIKSQAQKHRNNLVYMDLICMNITSDKNEPKERIFACETAIKLWKTLIEDENFLFYHCRIAMLYSDIAKSYAQMLDKENTLGNLKSALFHAEKHDNLPEGILNFTGKHVFHATHMTAGSTKNYIETEVQLIKKAMNERTYYDFIRSDPEFIELLNI